MSERVKDWLTGNEMDIQGLLRVAEVNEKVSNFVMGSWCEDQFCGTVACLIGHFCLSNSEDALQLKAFGTGDYRLWIPVFELKEESEAVAARFGISENEADLLFMPSSYVRGNKRDYYIRRLRKFIYYKLRKNELLADYEKARRTGDVGVMQEAEAHAGRLRLAEV